MYSNGYTIVLHLLQFRFCFVIRKTSCFTSYFLCQTIIKLVLDTFHLPRTLGFVRLRLTLFKRGDFSRVIQKSLTTSFVVACDSVNFLVRNHTKCFNIVIFSKLIFSFKVLMYCSCENAACFLCLLTILKWTLDYFNDGSKHNESRTDCDSCNGLTVREKDFNLHFCTRNQN